MFFDIRLRVLGSGSSGNATLVSAEGTTVLVEAGLSGRELVRRIRLAGRDPEEIAAVLVSHEHGDHAQGVLPFAAPRRVPVACSAGTWECLATRPGKSPPWIRLVPGSPAKIGALTITPFATPHDAAEPLGFRIDNRSAAVVHVTDFGYLADEIADAIEGAEVLVIESNYDEQRLHESRYPFGTVQRIASRYGHLSNGALALYLRRSLPRSVRTVVLAHLSENTNTPALALRTAREALDAGGRREVRLLAAGRHQLTPELRTRSSAPVARPRPRSRPAPRAPRTAAPPRSLFHPA